VKVEDRPFHFEFGNVQGEREPCPLCGGRAASPVGTDNGYTIERCADPGCGFVFVNPRPDAATLEDAYRDFLLDDAEAPALWERALHDLIEECATWLCEGRAPGRVLDVGCAYGDLLVEMERRGWQSVGVDPASKAVALARERTRGEIHEGFFEDVALDEGGFDAVVALYVLEHVRDPRGFLEKIRRVLRDDGIAIVRVPWSRPFFPISRLLGRPLLYAPIHLNDFSPTSLRRLARDVGFARVEVTVGRPRRSDDPLERTAASVLSAVGRGLERLSGGRMIFPLCGALSYRLYV